MANSAEHQHMMQRREDEIDDHRRLRIRRRGGRKLPATRLCRCVMKAMAKSGVREIDDRDRQHQRDDEAGGEHEHAHCRAAAPAPARCRRSGPPPRLEEFAAEQIAVADEEGDEIDARHQARRTVRWSL